MKSWYYGCEVWLLKSGRYRSFVEGEDNPNLLYLTEADTLDGIRENIRSIIHTHRVRQDTLPI